MGGDEEDGAAVSGEGFHQLADGMDLIAAAGASTADTFIKLFGGKNSNYNVMKAEAAVATVGAATAPAAAKPAATAPATTCQKLLRPPQPTSQSRRLRWASGSKCPDRFFAAVRFIRRFFLPANYIIFLI